MQLLREFQVSTNFLKNFSQLLRKFHFNSVFKKISGNFQEYFTQLKKKFTQHKKI